MCPGTRVTSVTGPVPRVMVQVVSTAPRVLVSSLRAVVSAAPVPRVTISTLTRAPRVMSHATRALDLITAHPALQA